MVDHGGGDGAGRLAGAGRGEHEDRGLLGEPHLASGVHLAAHQQRGPLRVAVTLAEDLFRTVHHGAAGEPVEVRAVGQASLSVPAAPPDPPGDRRSGHDDDDRHRDGRVGEPVAGEAGTGDLFGGEQL